MSQVPKALLFLKVHEQFYSELQESYTLKAIDFPGKKPLIELKLANIDSIVMKNII